jgi:hypothetical protein
MRHSASQPNLQGAGAQGAAAGRQGAGAQGAAAGRQGAGAQGAAAPAAEEAPALALTEADFPLPQARLKALGHLYDLLPLIRACCCAASLLYRCPGARRFAPELALSAAGWCLSAVAKVRAGRPSPPLPPMVAVGSLP